MPNIGFSLTNPQLTYSKSLYATDGWRLSFTAELGNRVHQHVDLTTEEKSLDMLDGSLGFQAVDEGAMPEGKGHGTLSYWEGSKEPLFGSPPAYNIELWVPAAQLQRIQQTMADGLPLLGINIDVPSLQFGWDPDGSGKKWDNAKDSIVQIDGYRLFFGIKPVELVDIEPDPLEQYVDTDAKSLIAIRQLQKTVQYILFAITALLAFLFLRMS